MSTTLTNKQYRHGIDGEIRKSEQAKNFLKTLMHSFHKVMAVKATEKFPHGSTPNTSSNPWQPASYITHACNLT